MKEKELLFARLLAYGYSYKTAAKIVRGY